MGSLLPEAGRGSLIRVVLCILGGGGGVLVAGAEAGRRCGIVHACCDMD